MSFYGDIKRINSSPYVFDKYYASRADMDDNASEDEVYVGRYVLVKYTCAPDGIYIPVSLNSSTYEPNHYYYLRSNNDYVLDSSEEFNSARTYYTYSSYTEKYDKDSISYAEIPLTSTTYKPNVYYYSNSGQMTLDAGNFVSSRTYYVKLQNLTEDYLNNATKDLTRYSDTYDLTVWQKVYTQVTNEDLSGKNVSEEKYILVGELKAAAPRLDFRIVNPKYYNSNGTLDENGNMQEIWRKPSVYAAATTEDAYTISMPNVLHLDVGDMGEDFYGKSLIDNPADKKIYTDIDISSPPENSGITNADWATYSNEKKRHIYALSSTYNYMKWQNYLNGQPINQAGKDIDTKKLDTKLYAFGQLISDLYDVLYGAPANGAAGLRPFYTEDLSTVIKNYDKGLIGILSSIATEAKGDVAEDLYGRKIQNGLFYYFISKWGDASEDPNNFIENIPNVIGASASLQGSSAKSQYYINFNATDGQYIKKF